MSGPEQQAQPLTLKDEWLERNFNERFSYVSPDSELAELILDLSDDIRATDKACNDGSNTTTELWQAAILEAGRANRRFKVIKDTLNLINADLAQVQKAPISPKLYGHIVKRNGSSTIAEITHKPNLGDEEKYREILLVNTVTHLILAENCHFHDRINASFEATEAQS